MISLKKNSTVAQRMLWISSRFSGTKFLYPLIFIIVEKNMNDYEGN